MSVAHRAARRGALASAGAVAKKTISYSSFPSVPAGTLDVAMSPGAGVVGVTSNALRETNSTATNATYRSAAVLPDVMGSGLFACTVTNANLVTADRGIGPGCFSADGTKGVYAIMFGNSNAQRIYSWAGGVNTQQAIAGTAVYTASSTDTITLQPSIAAGVVTWTLLKNGASTGLSWTDSSHVVDLPGAHPAACFQRFYSGAHYPSPGIKALTATDL